MIHKADFKPSDYLEWFASENVNLPIFRLSDGKRCGTNGRIAVVTPQDGPVSELKRPTLLKSVPDMLAKEAFRSETMDRARLSAVAGPCEYVKDEHCDGCECGNCDGGWFDVGPEVRPVNIWGKPINANFVALVLAKCPPCESVSVEQCLVKPTDKRSMDWFLRIVGTDWTAIIYGMTNQPDDEERHVRDPLRELIPDNSATDPRHA